MTERSDLLDKLHDLRELSKKKHQLAKPEQEEALKVLSALCTIDENGYRTTIEALNDFQSDIGAALLAGVWPKLMEDKFPVSRDLQNDKFNTDLGKRLRISLAHRLLTVDAENALRVLIDVCQAMKPAKNPIPTSKDLGLLRTALIEQAGQTLGRLPLANAMTAEQVMLTAYLLASAFINNKSKPLTPQTQLAMIRWANGCPKLGQLSPDVRSAIIQSVQVWSGDFRKILAEEIGTFQAPLRDVLAPVLRTESAAEKPNPVLEPAVPPPTVEATEVHKAGVTAQYDALYEVGRIGKYVQNLEAQLKQNRQTLQNVERDWQQTRNELGVARREREEARRQAAVDHESVACIEAENNGLKSEVERLRLEILRLKGQITATENRHEQAAASHAAQLDTLSERIEREGEHRVGAFRNKLAAKVQTYADGLKDANAMQMTEELGTAIRNQLRQLLRLLKAEGVRIHGDL